MGDISRFLHFPSNCLFEKFPLRELDLLLKVKNLNRDIPTVESNDSSAICTIKYSNWYLSQSSERHFLSKEQIIIILLLLQAIYLRAAKINHVGE